MLAIALAIAGSGASSHAQPRVTIYRCTDASGAVTVQNDRPCPKGTRQQKRAIETAATPAAAPPAAPVTPAAVVVPVPVVTPAVAPAPPLPDVPQAPVADAVRTAPPALYACRAYDDSTSLTESEVPATRCAPLATTGLGGQGAGAGQACETVTDTCTAVPADALCERWRDWLREARGIERLGANATVREEAAVVVARAEQVMRESTCGP